MSSVSFPPLFPYCVLCFFFPLSFPTVSSVSFFHSLSLLCPLFLFSTLFPYCVLCFFFPLSFPTVCSVSFFHSLSLLCALFLSSLSFLTVSSVSFFPLFPDCVLCFFPLFPYYVLCFFFPLFLYSSLFLTFPYQNLFFILNCESTIIKQHCRVVCLYLSPLVHHGPQVPTPLNVWCRPGPCVMLAPVRNCVAHLSMRTSNLLWSLVEGIMLEVAQGLTVSTRSIILEINIIDFCILQM